ncbi:probable disease resistance RPP8-like protein 4 [Humulus lupulus]|uniref:probable disease resistance RPP8-like protein 4 n=1 Tax=Humulus lupulus TaxID=3486 RepID=UPI002B412563|nr:probable disease resistance RPP8-like protein 4 [Humulus lupulus]
MSGSRFCKVCIGSYWKAYSFKAATTETLYFSDVQPMVPIPPITTTYLPDLQTLNGLFISDISTSDREDCLSKFTALRSLNLHGRLFPEWDLSSLTHLYKLHLVGSMQKMFDIQCFPKNLAELILTSSLLMEDPKKKLEKLRSLRVLKLKQAASVGREMTCSSGGFVQLQLLKLSFMNSVVTLRIEEGVLNKI